MAFNFARTTKLDFLVDAQEREDLMSAVAVNLMFRISVWPARAMQLWCCSVPVLGSQLMLKDGVVSTTEH
jgi:hypothetical protein